MKLTAKRMVSLMLVMLLVCALLAVSASAADTADAAPAAEAAAGAAENSTGAKAIAAAVVVAIAIGKSAEGMSRQPEASGSIRSSMMLGLVFIETAIIYALIVAILIIFVL